MEVLKNGGDVVIFADFHQSTDSTVLNELKFLEVFVWYTDEQAVTVVKPGGDKGVDEFLCVREGEEGAEFRNVLEMEEVWWMSSSFHPTYIKNQNTDFECKRLFE